MSYCIAAGQYGGVLLNGVNGMGDTQNLQMLGQQGVMQSNLVQICKYSHLLVCMYSSKKCFGEIVK